MSRSLKKNPYATDSRKTFEKRVHSRRFRKIIRQRLQPWKYRYYYHQRILCGFCECDELGLCPWIYVGDEPEFPHPFEITNPALVCDFRFYSDDPRDRRK